MKDPKEVKYDVDGYEFVTNAIKALVNQYPGLDENESFLFNELPSEEGVAIFPSTGVAVYDERESITGHVTQMCQYPFATVYRASGLNQTNRIRAKEWLDTFGRWLEKQTVSINGKQYVLKNWPELTGDREIREISRQSPSYSTPPNEDKSEDWIIDMMVRYRNEFDR